MAAAPAKRLELFCFFFFFFVYPAPASESILFLFFFIFGGGAVGGGASGSPASEGGGPAGARMVAGLRSLAVGELGQPLSTGARRVRPRAKRICLLVSYDASCRQVVGGVCPVLSGTDCK